MNYSYRWVIYTYSATLIQKLVLRQDGDSLVGTVQEVFMATNISLSESLFAPRMRIRRATSSKMPPILHKMGPINGVYELN